VVVGVDGLGRYDHEEVLAAVDATDGETSLVSVQLANHEVGTVQPVEEVVRGCRERGALVHVDACAAFGALPVDFAGLGADLCSVTAHKAGGPKGVGALLVRQGLRVPPFVVGGAQERARRGGIENVPAIVGFGAAACEVRDHVDADAARFRALTDRLATEAVAEVDGLDRYGDPARRLANLVCIGVQGIEAEPVLLGLDQRGVACHSGSACSSETLEPSPVLEAMGVDAERSLRVSVGWSSTDDDVDAFLTALPPVVEALRALYAGA